MATITKKPGAWKTVRYGADRAPGGLLMPYSLAIQLERKGCRLSEHAEDILSKIKTSLPKSEIDVTTVTPRDLGITETATVAEIYKRAAAMGLELCKAEIAVYLRLQYDSQPEDDVLHIAMKPIENSVGYPRNFYLTKKDGVSWLRTRSGYEKRRWPPDTRWVFATSNPRIRKN